ncbi:branched-chain amino acid ABC transporter permease [Aureimonas populi]|uniref:Branched-chain amino acid ABC transporter permease n=1 Tax=Aureimonas populi TaxID=1701758 RepID=A0ABW5CFF5_9HYPH|nr:branched-chain amino acid ABC transporter permease [Aureimonas populi]
MDFSIFLILLQDGVVNGAIYALLALGLVLIFTVTRIVFVPIGDFVSYGALTLAALEAGRAPGTVWLLLILGGLSTLISFWFARNGLTAARVARILGEGVVLPLVVFLAIRTFSFAEGSQYVRVLAALAVVTPIGLYLYNIVYRPIAHASVLVLLVVSVALHLAMVGLGLVFFGAEGSGTQPLSTLTLELGPLFLTGQAIAVVAVTLALIAGLFVFFDRTLMGKALRATAVNRLGARLVGVSPVLCGKLGFVLATAIATLSGILVSSLTTIYYDTGFIIALKGFVAAIVGGLVSYPISALAAVLVGVVEAFSSFYASAFKEVIIFMMIIPVLLWRSFRTPVVEDEE